MNKLDEYFFADKAEQTIKLIQSWNLSELDEYFFTMVFFCGKATSIMDMLSTEEKEKFKKEALASVAAALNYKKRKKSKI